MSIRARVEEAQLLFNSGYDHAALILAATAIAASARLSFPKKDGFGDRKAFVTYLDRQLNYLLAGHSSDQPSIVLIDGERQVSIGELIYVEFRCNLMHEGSLPVNVQILDDNRCILNYAAGKIEIGRGWIPLLLDVVVQDPQHFSVFGNMRRPMHDDLTWIDDQENSLEDQLHLSPGRITILKQFIAAAGLTNIREMSADELKALWTEKVLPDPRSYGLNAGAITGLKTVSPVYEAVGTPILEKDGEQYRLSDWGAAAIIKLSKNLKWSLHLNS